MKRLIAAVVMVFSLMLAFTGCAHTQVAPGTVRQGFSLSAGGYCTLADTPVSIQTSIASFSTAWSTGSSASGVLGALFLFPVIPSTAANSSFAS